MINTKKNIIDLTNDPRGALLFVGYDQMMLMDPRETP